MYVKVTNEVVQYHPHHISDAPAKLEVATSSSFGKDAFSRKYIIRPCPWRQGHTNDAKYHLHPVTYAPVKFATAIPNSLAGGAFTIQYILLFLALGSKS